MNRPQILILAASLAFGGVAYAAAPAAKPAVSIDASNPFAKPSTLPFQYPAFDKVKDEHFMPAFNAGMAQHLAEIEAIANNPKPATFENTIVAMEKSGDLLDRVSTFFFGVKGAHTNDAKDAIASEMSPKLAAHSDAIFLNPKLYSRIKSLYEKRDSLKLNAEQKHLLERYNTDFVRAGVKLSGADKEKLKSLNGEIAKLQNKFTVNVLKETNASALIVDTREELAGMSEAQITAAAAAAKARGHEGKYAIALVNTSGQPSLSVLTNRSVRERLSKISLERGSRGGEFDNRELVRQLAKLRAEKAALLGYENFAAYQLEDRTAKTTGAVNGLLAELAKPAVVNARKEAADIQKMIAADKGDFEVSAADWDHYTDKVRTERYAFDQSQLKPYFELDNVLVNGVFYAANRLYGLSFKERKDLPVYHEDVRVFDVIDHNGKQLAIFIADMYARPSKRGGAWANAYVPQSKLNGTRPVISNNLNIPKPPKGEPTLMTYDEVRTAFHEFGHALHGMFSDVTYPRFAGTSVPRDFVEYPSQVNEMWMDHPEVLANYAKHYKTGAPMPKELLDKVIAADKFNQGMKTTENVAASLLDQRWHQLKASEVPSDVLAFEAAALKEAGVDFAPVPPRYRTTYFSHVFSGGYSAGYYSYLWSEKLDADTVEWFNENGGLQRKNGDHFRKTLLSKGGTMDAMDMYRKFRGRDAKIEPLLVRRGLNAQ